MELEAYMLRTIFGLLVLLTLTNCASKQTAENTFLIARGMDEQDVKEVMGEPDGAFRDHTRDTTRFLYRLPNGFGNRHPYVVLFQSGRVIGMGYASGSQGQPLNLDTHMSGYNQNQPIVPMYFPTYQMNGWR